MCEMSNRNPLHRSIELANGADAQPPTIDLDPNRYKLVDQSDEKTSSGVPSLKNCRELTVRSPVSFNSANIFKGNVSLTNKSPETRALPPGEYTDCTKEL